MYNWINEFAVLLEKRDIKPEQIDKIPIALNEFQNFALIDNTSILQKNSKSPERVIQSKNSLSKIDT